VPVAQCTRGVFLGSRWERASKDEELLAPQKEQGYGEDEGEREESLPPE